MDAPFDRRLKRVRRDRAAHRFAGAAYLHRRAADELLERLDSIKREFREALDLGCADGYLANELRRRGLDVTAADCGRIFAENQRKCVRCDEDRLAMADSSFDLVVSVGVLDSVNDLPGALTLIRRSLKPDGLFLAAFAGAGSLPRLRSAMQAADSAATGGGSPRIHPQIDVRAAGDLLARAGFALPVADVDSLEIRFNGLASLVSDLRAMGSTNLLTSRSKTPLNRVGLAAAIADFAAAAGSDGRTAERFEIIHLIGWRPAANQRKPAARGSATASLATALRKSN